MASKNFSLQKLTHPSPSGGGSSNGLDYRETLDETGGAEAPPFEPPKTGGRNDEAAGSAEKLRLSSQNLHESPISAPRDGEDLGEKYSW